MLKQFAYILLSFTFLLPATFAYTNPGLPSGYLNDFAHILTTEQRALIENKLAEFERITQHEVSVVTISSLGGDTAQHFAVQLFQEWGIGKTGANNGVLLLIAPNDRQTWIAVGYGLEAVLTDAQANQIVQKVLLPAFRVQEYYSGIDKATDAIIALTQGEDVSLDTVSSTGGEEDVNSPFDYMPIVIFLGYVYFFSLIIFSALAWHIWRIVSGAILGALMGLLVGSVATALIIGVVLAIISWLVGFIKTSSDGDSNDSSGSTSWTSSTWNSNSSSSSSSDSSGGFGGFGGFGGGKSGGGGAGGSW